MYKLYAVYSEGKMLTHAGYDTGSPCIYSSERSAKVAITHFKKPHSIHYGKEFEIKIFIEEEQA